MASLAEYVRELIRERTNAGMQSARARGRAGGRPKKYKKEIISYAFNIILNAQKIFICRSD